MTDKPNFVLIPDDAPSPAGGAPVRTGGALDRLRSMASTIVTAAASPAAALLSVLRHAEPPMETAMPARPRLVFAVDATASREPAWAAARQVTDALVKALPGQLDVALAVHGGSRVHTFTAFTSNAATLRDRAAGVACQAGMTRLLPILSASLKQPAVRVVIYIGDVFEESVVQGRRLADTMGQQGTKLIVLHDTADPDARRDAEVFWDLAKRTGGCVLPFDASASGRLRDILSAVAVYAVGGEKLLHERAHDLPGAIALLEHLGKRR
ncbi:MAG: hypothetical protein QOF70_7053 [Acetobacteraceae bacterium]|jgi:hypothetical protein|nr:hypothetical protein [Acetobacteraceae bacterium]